MDLKSASRNDAPPQAPLVEPTPPVPAEDPFKPDAPVKSGKKPRQPKNSGGFKKFLLFIVILALIGGTGYGVYYWQHKQVDKLAKQTQGLTHYVTELQAQVTKLTADNKKLTDAASTTATTSSNTFKIPELGIQLTVPASLKDLTYTIRNGKYDDGSQFIGADLSTKALTAADKQCASTATPALGGLFRSEGTGPTTATSETAPPVALKQFSGFYISQSYGQAACSSTKSVTDAVATAKAAYKTALSSLELVK